MGGVTARSARGQVVNADEGGKQKYKANAQHPTSNAERRIKNEGAGSQGSRHGGFTLRRTGSGGQGTREGLVISDEWRGRMLKHHNVTLLHR
ncbi:MAG: hypothetical protein DMF15_02160 [Verrucomicrobia bacterium]|nr:MAG: hypothetical protein DMF15_02160 [Verrucomicrobiota bacterium]